MLQCEEQTELLSLVTIVQAQRSVEVEALDMLDGWRHILLEGILLAERKRHAVVHQHAKSPRMGGWIPSKICKSCQQLSVKPTPVELARQGEEA